MVIGAGMAGMVAAVRLAEEGRRVVVLATGVGSIQLSPGTIDVLGYAPDLVESPTWALPRFVEAHPDHPYARLAPWILEGSVEWFKGLFSSYRYVGGLMENLLIPTPVGVPKPSAAVPETMAGGDLRRGGTFVIAGLRGLKDFYPVYVADNLSGASLPSGASVSARGIELEVATEGLAEVGQLAFARRFEDASFRKAVLHTLQDAVEPGETVGLPAVLGLDQAGAVWEELREGLGTAVFEIPTLPPSVPGLRVFRALREALRRAGGRLIVNATVIGAEAEGRRVNAVVAQSAARPIAYPARSFVLASGGIAARGLEMDSSGTVRETVFGLTVAGVPESGKPRFAPGYFDPQPLAEAGVAVDERLRPSDLAGEPVYENVYAAGAILGGAMPWKEKSGDGISLATGYGAATNILEGTS
ncbi:MAG: glycerol-3-phosphate dehydrogenase subunit GlpB [Actinomycetota bacterium]